MYRNKDQVNLYKNSEGVQKNSMFMPYALVNYRADAAIMSE